MMEVKFEGFPILDESIPKIPVRSRYYHLQPLGLGTAMSECLTSYICRLASAHSVSVGNLFEFSLVPELKKDYLKASDGFGPASKLRGGYKNQIKNINGIGKTSQEWHNMLEKITLRNDLICLTFLKMSQVLSRRYVNRGFQAWCSFCLEEMKTSNSEIYYPLIWTLLDVKVCYIHQTLLIDICPHCSKQFYPLASRTSLGFCSRCKLWLGNSQNKSPQSLTQLTEEELKWNLFVSKETSELIALISNPTTEPFTASPAETIRLCVQQVTDGKITPFSQLIKTHLATFYGWYKGKQKPRLKDILKICYCLNLTILDFLTHPEILKTKEIEIREWLGIDIKPPRQSPIPFDKELVKSKLKKYINIYPPVSMAEVCRKIGYDKGLVVTAFPEINDQIKKKYYEYRKSVAKNKRNELEREIKFAVGELEKRGEFVSARRVAKFLNKPNYLNRRDVAQIILNTRTMGKVLKKSK